MAPAGRVAVVGAINARSAASAPVVLVRGGNGTWALAQTLAPAAGTPPDASFFGYAAALSDSGALIAVGAVGCGGGRGAAFVFEGEG